MGKDTFVEEYQGIHRLILGRRSDLAVHGEVRNIQSLVRREKVCARPHVGETDEPDNPLHIGVFGVNRVVVETEYLTDFIEEFCVDFLLHPAYQGSVTAL